MQLVEATCKFPGKAIQTKFGEKANAVFTLLSGDDVTIWGPPDYPPFRTIRRGDRVQLAKDHKGNCRLVENSPKRENSPNGESPKGEAGWSLDEKKAIAAKIEQQAALLRFCLETAQRQFGDIVEPADLRPLATTLFINALKGQ